MTGASRGLGRAMALALAGAGAAVALAARSRPNLEETARLIDAAGGRATVVFTDLSVDGEVDAIVQATIGAFGRLDVLVNNSGIAKVVPFAEMSPEDWRQVIDVNLHGVFNGCRVGGATPDLAGKRQNHQPRAVSRRRRSRGLQRVRASKSGVIALTRTLGVELARHNVQVMRSRPGGPSRT